MLSKKCLVRDCASCNWLLHPASTSAQDGLDPLQLALLGNLDSRPTIVLTLASSSNPFFPAKGKCLTPGNDHSRKLSGMKEQMVREVL